MVRWLLRLASIVLVLSSASAAPANPIGRLYEQPDGSKTPELFLKGDQHYNWMADKNGYTVILNEQDWWVYANKEDGELVSSGLRVGYANPKKMGLVPNLKTDHDKRPISHLVQHDEAAKDHRELLNVPKTALCNFQGTKNNPCRLLGFVLLVRFKNHARRVLPAPEEYDILFNHNGPTSNGTAPTGSVADVFMANSYDSFVLESHITPWVQVSRTEAQTVDGNNGLNMPGTKATWKEAMTILERSGYDFKKYDRDRDGIFDCMVVMHSGAAAETGGTDCEFGVSSSGRVWSHATSQTWFESSSGVRNNRFYVASGVWDTCANGGAYRKWTIARIAVIAHECAHFLGLPDLYDSDGGTGVGNFDLQANMWGWQGTQLYPPLMGAWCKYKLKWTRVVRITRSDEYTVKNACTSNTIYLIDYKMPSGEYFLIENRFPCGFDSELKSRSSDRGRDRNGIALWHVDESNKLRIGYQTEGYPGDGTYPATHYEVALVQSDGAWDMEKGYNRGDNTDLFRRSTYSGHAETAYRIDPNGVTLNNGSRKKYPNTNSYANGYESKTGITLEFGPAASTMTMKVTLEGAPSTTPRPTRRPTPAPTKRPTPRPTRRPTQRPTPAPTRRPTPAPTTRGATPRPTRRPTPAPTQRTPEPTPGGRSRPTPPPADGFTCDNSWATLIAFDFYSRRRKRTFRYTKNCHYLSQGSSRMKQRFLCGLDNELRPGYKVYHACQRECSARTNCDSS